MEPIDFVITWVDGSDPAWQKEKAEYSPKKEEKTDIGRYRDMELLPYWFRAVEAYAPWVRTIHFVTWGMFPRGSIPTIPKCISLSTPTSFPQNTSRPFPPTLSS